VDGHNGKQGIKASPISVVATLSELINQIFVLFCINTFMNRMLKDEEEAILLPNGKYVKAYLSWIG